MRKRVLADLAKRPGVTATWDEQLDGIKVVSDEVSSYMFLDNLLATCAQAETLDECNEVITEHVSRSIKIADLGDDEVDPSSIRVVIRDRQYLHEIESMQVEMSDAELPTVVHQSFIDQLVYVYVVDSPTSMALLNKEQLGELELSLSELHALALKNLRQHMSVAEGRKATDELELYVINNGDSYESARLALHKDWAPVAASVQGDLIVVAPSRDFVFYAGSKSGGGTDALRALAEADDLPYRITPVLLKWTPQRWVVYDKTAQRKR